MIKQLWENYKKPVPVKWRKRGDFALALLMALQPFLITAPFNEKVKWYIDVAFTILIVTFKFWTNTKKHEETNPINNNNS